MSGPVSGRPIAGPRQVALALVLAVAAAGLVNALAHRHPLRTDWTRAGRHSLHERTRAALARLTRPVRLVAVVSVPAAPDTEDERLAARVVPDLEALLQALRRAAPERLQIETLDALRDPPGARASLAAAGARLPNVVLVSSAHPTSEGTAPNLERGSSVEVGATGRRVVGFERLLDDGGEASDRAVFRGEEALLAAILAVSSPSRPVVYFTSGHGERSLDERGAEGLTRLAELLAESGYDARPLPLASVATVPADARLVVLAGPRASLAPQESARLAAFVAGGGALLCLLDPLFSRSGIETTGLEGLLGARGLILGRALLHDPAGAFPSTPTHTFLARELGSHLATRALRGDALYFAGPREVSGGEALVWTSARGQRASEPGAPPEGKRARWPLAAAVERTAAGAGPLLVVGDSDLASNAQLDTGGDARFLLGAIEWQSGEAAQLELPARPTDARRLTLGTRELRLAFWLFVLVLPLLAATVAAGLAFARRRRA